MVAARVASSRTRELALSTVLLIIAEENRGQLQWGMWGAEKEEETGFPYGTDPTFYNRNLENCNEYQDGTNQAGDIDGGVYLPATAGDVGDGEAEQRNGDEPVGLVHARPTVQKHHDDEQGRDERRGVEAEEHRQALAVAFLEDGVSWAVAAPGVPEAPWRAHPGHVGDADRERGKQHQDLPEPFIIGGGTGAVNVGGLTWPKRGPHHLDADPGDGDTHQHHGVDGGGRVSAGAGHVGPRDAQQVQHHDGLQRLHVDHAARPHLVHEEDEDDDDQRRREGRGVAVVEGQVPAVAGGPDDGVAGEVARGGVRVLPDAPRRAERRRVRHRRHQRGQQQDVLAQVLQEFARRRRPVQRCEVLCGWVGLIDFHRYLMILAVVACCWLLGLLHLLSKQIWCIEETLDDLSDI